MAQKRNIVRVTNGLGETRTIYRDSLPRLQKDYDNFKEWVLQDPLMPASSRERAEKSWTIAKIEKVE